jgi:hypothetical protein
MMDAAAQDFNHSLSGDFSLQASQELLSARALGT